MPADTFNGTSKPVDSDTTFIPALARDAEGLPRREHPGSNNQTPAKSGGHVYMTSRERAERGLPLLDHPSIGI